MQKKLKWAVIGTGNMGGNHVRTLDLLKDIQLCGIVDPSKKQRDNISKKYPDLPTYETSEELYTDQKPDVVSICVPTKLHTEVTRYFLNKKIHCLLEKPIAMTPEEGIALIELAKAKKTHLFVGHIERFNPAVRRVKDMINKGSLGKVTAIIARRVGGFPPQIKDANIAVDLAIHDIDIINYLLEEQPKEVYCNKQKNHIEKREDAVEFFLKYSKASAYIQANWITPVKIRKLNITGTEGYLEMDYINQKIEFYESNYEKFKESSNTFSDYILRFSEPDKVTISVAKKEPLREEIEYFMHALLENKPIDPSFSVEALRIATTKNSES